MSDLAADYILGKRDIAGVLASIDKINAILTESGMAQMHLN